MDLQQARNELAKEFIGKALSIKRGNWGFASHVDDQTKRTEYRSAIHTAKLVVKGLYDHQFWCWQKLNYYMTGVSVPLLAN